jgi:hypothetical protein
MNALLLKRNTLEMMAYADFHNEDLSYENCSFLAQVKQWSEQILSINPCHSEALADLEELEDAARKARSSS